MTSPADTIREALNYPKRPHKGMTLQALAALTELEQQLAAGERARRQITEGMASLCNRAEAAEAELRDANAAIDNLLAEKQAAEADRDGLAQALKYADQKVALEVDVARVERARAEAAEASAQTLRDALEDLAGLERPADLMRQIARAALATPDTPPVAPETGYVERHAGLLATPDTPPTGICPECTAGRHVACLDDGSSMWTDRCECDCADYPKLREAPAPTEGGDVLLSAPDTPPDA